MQHATCDNLPARALECGAEKLGIPLANLYNSCIINRQWPSNRKRREWTPVFKKEDPQDSRNYRPITVLPVVSIVFEQLLSDQISKQFDEESMRNANRASELYASNLLKGNLSKFQTMTFKHNRTESNIPLHLQGNIIDSSECLKLLVLSC